MLSEPPRDDAGAVLVLALVLLIVGTTVIGGLMYAIMNDLNSSSHFKAGRSLEYAASSAVNQAIQSIRYSPMLGTGQTLNASPPSYCWGSSSPSQLTSIDGVSAIDVWCSTLWTPTSATSRVVTISACPSSTTAANCAQNPLLQAVVTFDDYPPGQSSPTTVMCDVYCGTGMKINSWLTSPVAPTVSALSVSSGPVTGGTSVTVTGTGFASGSTVSLVEESAGAPTPDNVVLAATGVTVNSPTSLTALTPSMTAGRSYFVTVTTPSGTSAYSTNAVFTFTPTTPTVSAISTSSGSTAGGGSITITGTGFVSGSVVNLYEESGGTVVSPVVVVPASNVTVASDTSITAITPAVTLATTFFVTVLTPGGSSAYTSSAIFTYTPLIPTILSISPTSGPRAGGTTVTITGTGFIVGSTVRFVQVSNSYNTYAGTNVNVVNATTITVTSPAVSTATTYYIQVKDSAGTSTNNTTFTYQ